LRRCCFCCFWEPGQSGGHPRTVRPSGTSRGGFALRSGYRCGQSALTGADSPPLRKQPRTETVSEVQGRKICTVDCPRYSSGLSAVHFSALVQKLFRKSFFAVLTCGQSGLHPRTVRRSVKCDRGRSVPVAWLVGQSGTSTADSPHLKSGQSAIAQEELC
jgi:hypothetical protein